MTRPDHRRRLLLRPTKAILMRPEQPNQTVAFDLPHAATLDELKDVILPWLGCEHMEHVSVLADFSGGFRFQVADMFIDEMGHAKGLPRNENATAIYRRNAVLNQGVAPEELPWIAGPALLFRRKVWS